MKIWEESPICFGYKKEQQNSDKNNKNLNRQSALTHQSSGNGLIYGLA